MPSFVVMSDLHVHPWTAFAKGDGASNSRLQASLKVLDDSLLKAHQLRAPWVFAGDLVHTAGYALNVVMAGVVGVMQRYPNVPKLAVWGNHDSRGIGGRVVLAQTVWATLAHAVPNLTVLDENSLRSFGGLTFAGLGAQPRQDLLPEAIEADVGIYHGMVKGAVGPSGYVFADEGFDVAELWKRHRVSIVGDLHHPQQWRSPGGDRLVLVPGSPEHHNFGDAGLHGWWVVEIEDTGVVAHFMPSGSPMHLTVETPDDVKADGNFYRVRTAPAYSELPPNAIAIAPAPPVVPQRARLNQQDPLEAWMALHPPPEPRGALELGRSLLSGAEPQTLLPFRLKRLRLFNFCSHADTSFEIKDGTWLVLGEGRDYPSNGAGKTTLFESLFWLLFGRTTKGLSGDEVICWGSTECEVSAEFEAYDPLDDTHSVLNVTRRRGSRSTLEVVEGEEGLAWEAASVNEMTDKLTAHLGITPELFQALCYFSQERLVLFASATDGQRKDMLADLIGLSSYQAASAEAQKRIEKIGFEAATRGGEIAATERQMQASSERLEAHTKSERDWQHTHSLDAESAEEALIVFDADAMVRRPALVDAAVQELARSLHGRMQAARKRVDAAEGVLAAEPRPWVATPHELVFAVAEEANTRSAMMRASNEASLAEARVSDAERRLGAAERALADGVCPSCGQEVNSEHLNKCLQPLRDEILTLSVRAAAASEAFTRAAEIASGAQAQLQRVEQGVKDGKRLEAAGIELKAAKAEVLSLEQEANELTAAASQHVNRVVAEQRAVLEARQKALAAQVNPFTAARAAAAGLLEQDGIKLMQLKASVVACAELMAAHEYWRIAFSRQGIQSLLMDEVAGAFNEMRGRILPALTQGVYDVQFSTQSATKAGELREKTEFMIFERGMRVPYEALSGGQRRRVEIGVMLTLIVAVSAWMQVPGVFGLLVLDEVFGFLDSGGAEGLAEALREMQQTVPSIYVISHEQELQALFTNTIVVAQDAKGISRVQP